MKKVFLDEVTWETIRLEYTNTPVSVTALSTRYGVAKMTVYKRMRPHFSDEEWAALIRSKHLHASRTKRHGFRDQRGPKNPNWNPNKSSEVREVNRRISGYKPWREAVLKRDNRACVRCGKGGRLVAHHLFNYTEHPELRLDLSNGTTLCVGCHTEFHRIHGVKRNNPDQFHTWLHALPVQPPAPGGR